MNHLEFARSESDALKPTDWEKWCTHLETLMGHSVDGDSDSDGYSMDEAYEMWKQGHTVFAVAYAFLSRGQYHPPVWDEYDDTERSRCERDWDDGVCLFPLDSYGHCGRAIEHNQPTD